MSEGEWKIYEHAWNACEVGHRYFNLLREYALSPIDPVAQHDPSIKAHIEPMRFSGDMNTSVGNSIHNWLLIRSALYSIGANPDCFFVEGDDAFVAILPQYVQAFEDRLLKCGMRLKVTRHSSPGECGFCHVWWTRLNHIPVTEIDHRLRNLPYASGMRIDPVLQLNARALSLYAEWVDCPVLGAVARALI